MLHHQTYFLQNDALRLGEYTLCGARGWKQRGAENFDAQDEKVFLRELERLKLSIAAAKKIGGRLIGISHYPPFSQNHGRSEFSDLYAEAGADHQIQHSQRIFLFFHDDPPSSPIMRRMGENFPGKIRRFFHFSF